VERELLGNAGALIENLEVLPEQFFVLYGDLMTAIDLTQMAQFHLERQADFTCLAQPNDHPHDSDLLEVDDDGRLTAIHAYPHPAGRDFVNLVNAAVYVARREALAQAVRHRVRQKRNFDFTKDVFAGLLAEGNRVFAYRSRDYVKDMGTPKRLKQVEADWAAGRINVYDNLRSRPAVFLDRDGTLNVEKGGVCHPQDLELFPGVGEALVALRKAGFYLVVLTNQPILARGDATQRDLAAVHRRLEWELGKAGAFLDGIYVCPHDSDASFPGERREPKISCECRKPTTGLLDRACRDLGIDLSKSWMIGDQTRDLEMAWRAGVRSILLETGAEGHDGGFHLAPNHCAPDLVRAAELIVAHSEARSL
jgi:D,D-heptose 1,7-bisphosphate phosphatase